MNKVINYIVARLLEPTSWLAVTAFSGAVAAALQSHNSLLISLLAGVTAVLLPEGKNT